MNTYTLKTIEPSKSPVIVRNDGAFIPYDEGNIDYVEYLAWVADGNTAEEWQTETSEEQ
jgi:hypothetical protein